MHNEEKDGASKNAVDKHVHTPESGSNPDDALAPGNTSGSGDVERAQRQRALKETAAAAAPGATVDQQPVPEGKREGAEQAKRILKRNRELLEGAEASAEGEEQLSGNRTESSTDGKRTGDYSND